jgi:hypothetical protein
VFHTFTKILCDGSEIARKKAGVGSIKLQGVSWRGYLPTTWIFFKKSAPGCAPEDEEVCGASSEHDRTL